MTGLLFATAALSVLFMALALAWPWLKPDRRARQMVQLAGPVAVRTAPRRVPLAGLVERLRARLRTEAEVKARLAQAGQRGEGEVAALLSRRLLWAIGLTILALFLVTLGAAKNLSVPLKLLLTLAAGGGGFWLPMLLLENAIQKRHAALTLSFPDGLDLLLICIDSGLSLDQALRRVSDELAEDHPELADELSVTVSELAFLPDRRQCFDNLAARCGATSIKTVAQALAQAERYGTPIAATLRAVAQDIRAERITRAEKAAGALPAKLTVPMILFFLPALLIVILGPAILAIAGGR